jgi:hypothetical protein
LLPRKTSAELYFAPRNLLIDRLDIRLTRAARPMRSETADRWIDCGCASAIVSYSEQIVSCVQHRTEKKCELTSAARERLPGLR